MNLLPNFSVVCKLDGQIAADIPVLVRIAMRTKNDFSIVAGATDSLGRMTVTGAVLEDDIASTISMFPMDYSDIGGPDSAFGGSITVHAMTMPEVESALRAYDYFSKEVIYPQNYRSKLEAGYRQLMKLAPRRMDVEISSVVDGTLTTRISTGSSAFPVMSTASH